MTKREKRVIALDQGLNSYTGADGLIYVELPSQKKLHEIATTYDKKATRVLEAMSGRVVLTDELLTFTVPEVKTSNALVDLGPLFGLTLELSMFTQLRSIKVASSNDGTPFEYASVTLSFWNAKAAAGFDYYHTLHLTSRNAADKYRIKLQEFCQRLSALHHEITAPRMVQMDYSGLEVRMAQQLASGLRTGRTSSRTANIQRAGRVVRSIDDTAIDTETARDLGWSINANDGD